MIQKTNSHTTSNKKKIFRKVPSFKTMILECVRKERTDKLGFIKLSDQHSYIEYKYGCK